MRHHLSSWGLGLALLAGVLSGCGGGGGGAATAAAASSNAGVSGISTQIETAASFALDGLDAGIYGLPKGMAPALPGRFEAPAAAPVHSVPTCSGGSVAATSVGADQSRIVYSNCVVDGSTLNGTITVAGPTTYVSNGVWTATFSGFSISGEGADGKTVKFNYSGNQVIRDVTWSGTTTTAEATAAKVTINVDISVDNGSSTINFTNYLVDFSYKTDTQETTLNMSGKFGYDLKLADFGIPATPGLPEKVKVEFDVSTPTALKFTETTDSGVYKLTSTLYTLEIDYTNDVAKFTAGGVTQSFPLGA
jgi:hypothetical protein